MLLVFHVTFQFVLFPAEVLADDAGMMKKTRNMYKREAMSI